MHSKKHAGAFMGFVAGGDRDDHPVWFPAQHGPCASTPVLAKLCWSPGWDRGANPTTYLLGTAPALMMKASCRALPPAPRQPGGEAEAPPARVPSSHPLLLAPLPTAEGLNLISQPTNNLSEACWESPKTCNTGQGITQTVHLLFPGRMAGAAVKAWGPCTPISTHDLGGFDPTICHRFAPPNQRATEAVPSSKGKEGFAQ